MRQCGLTRTVIGLWGVYKGVYVLYDRVVRRLVLAVTIIDTHPKSFDLFNVLRENVISRSVCRRY